MKEQYVIKSEQIAINAHKSVLRNWQAALKNGDCLEVNIVLHKSSRNIEQNKRLHAMLQEIANQVWHDGKQYGMEVWKEYFKRMFLSVVDLPDGKLMASPTHKLSVKDCVDFMQKIEAYAASEFGVVFEK